MTVMLGIRAVAVNEVRWTPQRKRKVLREIDGAGAERRAALMAEHGLTPDEISQWRIGFERHGISGLSALRQERRS